MVDISIADFTPAEALINLGPDPSIIEEIVYKYLTAPGNVNENVVALFLRDSAASTNLLNLLETHKIYRGLFYIEYWENSTGARIYADTALESELYPLYDYSKSTGINNLNSTADQEVIFYLWNEPDDIKITKGNQTLKKAYFWYYSINTPLNWKMLRLDSKLNNIETFVGVPF
jgi:hypothetical protein